MIAPSGRALTHAEKLLLVREFKNAQRAALRALEHRHRAEFKELEAAQRARKREWDQNERLARRKFFDENRKGKERRQYMQDFLVRQKSLKEIMAAERENRKRENEVRLKSMKEDQAQKLKEFQEYIKRGERPPEHLWPN